MQPVESDDETDGIDEIELVSLLTRLHVPLSGRETSASRSTSSSASLVSSLEHALLQRHAALYGGAGPSAVATQPGAGGGVALARAGRTGNSAQYRSRGRLFAWTFRLAVACAALSVTVGAVASIPTEIEAPVGWAVTIELPARTKLDVDALLQHVAAVSSGDQISIALQRESDDEPLTLSIDVWSSRMTLEQVLEDLYTRVPALRDAPVEERPIKRRMQTSLGGRIGFDVLGRLPDRILQEAREVARLERSHRLPQRQRTIAARFEHNGHRGLKIVVIRQETEQTMLEF